MSAFWFSALPSPPEADRARETTDNPRTDDVATETTEIEFNSAETDDSTQLTGLSPRATTGVHHASLKPNLNAQSMHPVDYVSETNNNQASAGTAAAREAAGAWGHGTMEYSESIEPVIRDGSKLGGSVFESERPVIQNGSGDYMSVGDIDGELGSFSAVAAALAAARSRKAFNDSLFELWEG